MPYEIKDKVAIITGAASGIGLGITKVLLQNGIRNVTIVDINETAGKEAEKQLCDEFGAGKAFFVSADVSNGTAFEDVFKQTVERFKNIDILINSAGTVDEVNWERTVDINLKSVIHGTLLAVENYIPKYKSGDGGLVINIASVGALVAFPGVPVYGGTKAAAWSISRAFGDPYVYERTKVRVVAVCPGHTKTPLLSTYAQKVYSKDYFEVGMKMLKSGKYPTQEISDVANGIAKVVREATTASTWVIEGGEVYEVEIGERIGQRKQ